MQKRSGNGRNPQTAVLLLLLMIALIALYLRGEQWLRGILVYLSAATWARNIVTQVPLARNLANRFIAGDTTAEAMAVVQELNQAGMSATINYLGEHVHTQDEAIAARDEILHLLDVIAEHGVEANVSIKPSQLGLQVNPQLLHDNMRVLLERAAGYGNNIRMDMEDYPTLDTTLGIYRSLRDEDGFGHHVGIVIQAYLRRTAADLAQLVAEGAWVRLCKGAYAEPPAIAFPEKADTDSNYVRMAQVLLSQKAREKGVYAGFATHDEEMITAVIAHAESQRIPPSAYEFQMLHGIRRDLQASLVRRGYRVRIYVPYGTAWYPYFVRRLAERPANLWFFLSNLAKR
jgi:proline dehydrogenase